MEVRQGRDIFHSSNFPKMTVCYKMNTRGLKYLHFCQFVTLAMEQTTQTSFQQRKIVHLCTFISPTEFEEKDKFDNKVTTIYITVLEIFA